MIEPMNTNINAVWRVRLVPDYANSGDQCFEHFADAERLRDRLQSELLANWLAQNHWATPNDYKDDKNSVDVNIYLVYQVTRDTIDPRHFGFYGDLVEHLLADHGTVQITEDEYGEIVDVSEVNV